MTSTRIAVIRDADIDIVKAYMPGNYVAYGLDHRGEGFLEDQRVVVLVGSDVAGWTLDDYVIPRLASGLMFAVEVTS